MLCLFHMRWKLLVGLVLIIGVILRIQEISRPLWFDENITITSLTVNPLKNPLYSGITTNLPLYFWLLRLVQLVPNMDEIGILRIFGLALNTLTGILAFYALIYSLRKRVGWIFFSIFLLSPIQIHYSAELRPYVLSQLMCCLLFIIVSRKIWNLKHLVVFNLVTVAGMLTHYSFYIFYMATSVYIIGSSKNIRLILKLSILPAVLALLIAKIYFSNPLFIDSLEGLELIRNTASPITRILDIDNVSRIKEVLSNYYYFGLYYYRLDFWAQFILKKLLLILFITGLGFAVIKRKSKDITNIKASIVILSVCLAVSLSGEKFGYYPFGGRHIMPFSFLLYIIVAYGLSEMMTINRFVKHLSIFVLVVVLTSFLFFQGCSQLFRDIYTGTGDPQGTIYSYCVKNLPNRLSR